jgi:hypothetical protein
MARPPGIIEPNISGTARSGPSLVRLSLSFLNRKFCGRIGLKTLVGNHEPAADGATVGSRIEPLFCPADCFQALIESCCYSVVGLLSGERLRRVRHVSGLVGRRSVVLSRGDRRIEELLHSGSLGTKQLSGIVIVHWFPPSR